MLSEPGAPIVVGHGQDAVVTSLAVFIDRPGGGGANEDNNKRGDDGAAAPLANRYEQANQPAGQTIDRQRINDDMNVFGLLQISQKGRDHLNLRQSEHRPPFYWRDGCMQ